MNLQTTTTSALGNDLSPEAKAFYDRALIRFASPNLVHTKFGQKRPIPKNSGKTIEFRRFSPLPKSLAPITEGVTPEGSKLNVTSVEARVNQYGDYITTSDLLNLTSFDNIAAETQKVLGDQAGRTLDSVVREVITGSENAQYGDGTKTSRAALTSGDTLSVAAIRRAVTTLKQNNAKPFKNGHYVAIIHHEAAKSLMEDEEWQTVKANADPKDWYEGTLGRIHGVVFVESSEAKVFKAQTEIAAGISSLTVASVSGQDITVSEALTSAEATSLANKNIVLSGRSLTIASATAGDAGSAKITVAAGQSISSATGAGDSILPTGGGAAGQDIYATLVLGADAYGVTSVEGGGLETIAKQLGSGGTQDPLNQRSTIGWKATQTACILSPEFMVRIETA